MKFVLVGHFCFDIHRTRKGGEEEQLGGLYNAASMLSARASKADTIVPVCGIAQEDYPRVAAAFEKLPGVSTEGLYKMDAPTNRVQVFERPDATTIVCSKDIAPPIPFERLRRHIDCDGLLINMISGFDISLETLDQVRIAAREEKTVIHFDFHNLTLGVNERHERYRRPVETWRRWAFMIDTVQLNEEEVASLDGSMHDERALIGHMLTLGVKGVLVTRGSKGLTVYIDNQKHLVREDVAIAPADGQEMIGAGDRFGAAFLHSVLTLKNISESARAVAASMSDISRDA